MKLQDLLIDALAESKRLEQKMMEKSIEELEVVIAGKPEPKEFSRSLVNDAALRYKHPSVTYRELEDAFIAGAEYMAEMADIKIL